VRPKPVQRLRIVGASKQDGIRHRDKSMQVERAGLTVTNPSNRESMAAGGGGAELAGQDLRARETDAAGR
jgi:hypothetical protein